MKKYLIISILFFGCYTSKKAEQDINKAKTYFPEVVSDKFSQWYKCDTVTIIKDSIKFKEWINEIHSFDTIIDTIQIRQKCPEVLIKYRDLIKRVPAIHDTIKLINRVEVELYRDKYEKLRTENEKSNGLINKLGLFSLLLLIVLLLIIVLKK